MEGNLETVALDFSLEELGQLALIAHKRDMTINQTVNYLIEEFIKEYYPDILEG